MYCLNDKQVEYILNDIRARGVEMEDLQYNLLDHVCCIIEQNLGEQGDFEDFYRNTIQRFYKEELWELEEETLSLIIFKNYYQMKKIMLYSGISSAFLTALGIVLKFLHLPGASISLVLGISLSSLVFLPLLFVLKIREKTATRDKLILGLGALAGMALSMGILFKIQHWPGANMLGMGSILLMVFVFLPIYFFTGIRNPETKVNTIVSSALIIIGCGLFMALVRAPRGTYMTKLRNTAQYVQDQEILQQTRSLYNSISKDSTFKSLPNSREIDELCENIKSDILFIETGVRALDKDFEARGLFLDDGTYAYNPFKYISEGEARLAKLSDMADAYNAALPQNNTNLKAIPGNENFISYVARGEFKLLHPILLLEQLGQMQMIVLENDMLATR